MRTVAELITHASHLTGVTTAQIYGPSHKRYICAVRCAVYVVANKSGVSLKQIGRRVARHHTSIMNALSKREIYERYHPQTVNLIKALRTGQDLECRFVTPPPPIKPKPTPRQVFYTSEIMERIDAMVQEGITINDIAESLDKTHASVASARTAWLKKNPNRKYKHQWPEGRLERVIELRQSGMRWKQIGVEIGIPSETLRTGAIRALPQSHLLLVPRSGSNHPARQCRPA